MRLIVVIACIIVAATAVVAQEDPCVAELARCRDACGNREILVNDCASASGFLSKACSCGGALDAPAGEEGAIETTSETVYFDGGAVAMLGSEDAQETKVRKRPEASSTRGIPIPPVNTRASSTATTPSCAVAMPFSVRRATYASISARPSSPVATRMTGAGAA